jgi:predicted metal-binding protein
VLAEETKVETALETLKVFLWHEMTSFDPRILSFTQEIRSICESNGCGRYNKVWNCPPAVGSLKELEKSLRVYREAILFTELSWLESPFDWDAMVLGGKSFDKRLALANNHLKQAFDGTDTAFKLFGSGMCQSCDSCTYPDAPCRYPDLLFTPIEACGINVVELSQKVGIAYNNGENTVTWFGMILIA